MAEKLDTLQIAEIIKMAGADIEVAIRAQGQALADTARARIGKAAADLVTHAFSQAADVAKLRTSLMQIEAMKEPTK